MRTIGEEMVLLMAQNNENYTVEHLDREMEQDDSISIDTYNEALSIIENRR